MKTKRNDLKEGSPRKSEKVRKKDKKQMKEQVQAESNESSFDFGGIPKRDLKRNLGCG